MRRGELRTCGAGRRGTPSCSAHWDGLRKTQQPLRQARRSAPLSRSSCGGSAVRRATQPRASIMDAKTGANIKSGKFVVGDKETTFPIYEGTVGPSVIDIGKFYAETGMF